VELGVAARRELATQPHAEPERCDRRDGEPDGQQPEGPANDRHDLAQAVLDLADWSTLLTSRSWLARSVMLVPSEARFARLVARLVPSVPTCVWSARPARPRVRIDRPARSTGLAEDRQRGRGRLELADRGDDLAERRVDLADRGDRLVDRRRKAARGGTRLLERRGVLSTVVARVSSRSDNRPDNDSSREPIVSETPRRTTVSTIPTTP
jgi:hypothetical protein